MHKKMKNYTLIICLVVFLFLSLGNGLHLTPAVAFLTALSGTQPTVFAFNRWWDTRCREVARKEETGSRIIPRHERP